MVKITGSKQWQAKLDRLRGARIKEAVGRALEATAQQVAVDAQISITNGSVSGKSHVPSAPGTPPNNDLGTLAGNMNIDERACLVPR